MNRNLLPKLLTIVSLSIVLSSNSFSQTRFINFGSSWKYLDNNTRPLNWETIDFEDLSWQDGVGELGYGDGDEGHVVSFGIDEENKYPTTYFRKTINIPDPSSFINFTFNIERDDAFVLYVNGIEVGRNNMLAGLPLHESYAASVVNDSIITIIVPNTTFSPTFNVIAVEIHQANAGSSEISFDLELIGNVTPGNIIFNNGDSWRYYNNSTAPPAAWKTVNIEDGVWKIGYGEIGFGESDEATVIFGGDPDVFPTIYFRKRFDVTNPAAFSSYTFSVTRDDGFVVYLNGVEIGRNNMAVGTPTHGTYASSNVEEEVISFTIPASLLNTGSNLLAVEMHQSNANSTDLSFNMKAAGVTSAQKVINYGSSWKYLDNNTRPAGWETSAFNDAAWASGNGELGFGDGDEATLVASGPNPGRYPTTYFRKTINMVNPSEFPTYTFSIERDDAFVVYVNGKEVGRNNMPAGVPLHTTLSTSSVDDAIVNFTVPNGVFTTGNNVIAVEVHQTNNTSSDLSFDLELTANSDFNVLISNNGSWKYWNQNNRPANWPATPDETVWPKGSTEIGFGDGDETTFFEAGLAGARWPVMYFRKTVNIEDVSAYSNYTFSVKRDDGFVLYVNGTERARNNYTGTPAHNFNATNVDDSVITFTLPASNFVNGLNTISVEVHQSNNNSSDLSFDLQMYGNYTNPTYIPFNASWSYLDTNARPAAWQTTAFNDIGWPTGYAKLGFGDADIVTTTQSGPVGARFITTYFRKMVNIPDASSFAGFNIGLVRDDGAVIYVNGVEVIRSNMPVPPVMHSTLATANIADAGEDSVHFFFIPASYFVNGNNVIAAEVHQDAINSSDLGFNLQLIGSDINTSPSIINYTDVWKFLDNGSDQGSAWRAPAFDDALWGSGPGKLGFGDVQATLINGGPANDRYRTTYFRKAITIANLSQYQSFTLNMLRDDGVVLYVNGNEVLRNNMPAGAINYLSLATDVIDDGAEEETPVSFSIPTTHFVEGVNTIAVEVHQVNITSSDLGFALEMVGSSSPGGSATLTRSPYLQRGTQTEITIRWRTAAATDSRVELGTSYPNNYTITVDSTTLTTEHIVRISGLTPDTKYWYRVGTTGQSLQGGADNFFTTVPAEGTRKVRVAAFGDCGRNETNFQVNTLTRYRNYLSTNGIDAADAWILLGDNAYNSGTESEFNNNFFNVYGPNILKNHKLYPAPGNHDYGSSANMETKNVPYFSLFTMPTNGEGGGVASNTKSFYSYNIGDIHFLSLDSYGTEAGDRLYDTTGDQVDWIKADLAANTNKWVVAYWHHPPYTKGSHNSDAGGSDQELTEIRENFIRILERNGVDLVICGHSHDYERSYLLKGYYKANPGDGNVYETHFNPATHTASNSSAKYDGSPNSCPYIYKHGKFNHGTVYVVSGNSGADGNTQAGYPHNALPFNEDVLGGMFYFEADSGRLDAKYIRSDGAIGDNFTIIKGANVADTFFIISGDQVSLDASWQGNYAWSNAATTRTITVTPPEGLSNYTVVDNQGCLKDSFAVYANICSGDINTWVGNVSTAWENPANWSCGGVPNTNSEVFINPGTPHSAIVNSDVVIKNITIRTGASVTVTTGFKLDVLEPIPPPGSPIKQTPKKQ